MQDKYSNRKHLEVTELVVKNTGLPKSRIENSYWNQLENEHKNYRKQEK